MVQNSTNQASNSVQQYSQEVIGALADAFGKSALTIQRWIDKKDIRLTSDPAKKVFAQKGIVWDGEAVM